MKKLAIAPFTEKEYPLIPYLKSKYRLTSLLAPKGIGIAGQDVSIFFNDDKTGYVFQNSLLKGIQQADVVLISDVSTDNRELYHYAKNALEISLENGKEVICALELEPSQLSKYQQRFLEKGINFQYIDFDKDAQEEMLYQNHTFDVPVIYVAEIIPECGGYELFLKLVHSLQSRGKNVLAISEDKYNRMIEQSCFRFWSSCDSSDDLIYRINAYVHSKTRETHPEVVVIRLPLPILKYNDEYPFDFGLAAYAISQAIPGDGCVLCCPSQSPIAYHWQQLNDVMISKFGYPVFGICINHCRVDLSDANYPTLYYLKEEDVRSEVSLLNKNAENRFFDFHSANQFDQFLSGSLLSSIESDLGVI